MKRVKLKLNSDSYHLSAVGYLYAAPAPPSDPPAMRPFSIRNTVFPEFDLEPGEYVLRFWVKNGEGRFDLLASGQREVVGLVELSLLGQRGLFPDQLDEPR